MTAEVGAGLYVVTVRVFCVRAAEFVLRGERPQKPWASEMGSPKCFPAYQPPSAWFVSDKTFRLCPEREIDQKDFNLINCLPHRDSVCFSRRYI